MAWLDYFKDLQSQLAMLLSGTEEDGTAIPDRAVTLDGEAVVLGAGSAALGKVDIEIGGVAPQLDTTDRLAVSLYGKASAAGDKEVLLDASGHVQVDVVGALPAGSAAIGKLAANTGVDIGDVDVLTINSVAPQFDDTDHLAVSLYGQARSGGAAGDTVVKVGDQNNLMVAAAKLVSGADGYANTRHAHMLDYTTSSGILGSMVSVFNDTGWDRLRNNTEVSLIASAAYTATQSSADQTNYNARGVMICLDVTAIVDTPSITIQIEGKFGDKYEKLLLSDAAVTAVGVHSYAVYPGITASDDVVEASSLPLPRTWRVTITHADTDSITYDINASYIL